MLAERVGFEPTVRLPVLLISSQAHSTTLAPLLILPSNRGRKSTGLPRFLPWEPGPGREMRGVSRQRQCGRDKLESMTKTRRTTTRSWAEGSEALRTAPRKPGSLASRFIYWLRKRDAGQATFRIGDRVRITSADPQFAERVGVEAIVVSGLERAVDGQSYYRLDNNMSARPECLTLLQSRAEATSSAD